MIAVVEENIASDWNGTDIPIRAVAQFRSEVSQTISGLSGENKKHYSSVSLMTDPQLDILAKWAVEVRKDRQIIRMLPPEPLLKGPPNGLSKDEWREQRLESCLCYILVGLLTLSKTKLMFQRMRWKASLLRIQVGIESKGALQEKIYVKCLSILETRFRRNSNNCGIRKSL